MKSAFFTPPTVTAKAALATASPPRPTAPAARPVSTVTPPAAKPYATPAAQAAQKELETVLSAMKSAADPAEKGRLAAVAKGLRETIASGK